MAVEFVDGDIFETDYNVALAHGCNCAGAMGKGIAIEFRRRWPKMYLEYKARCQNGEFSCGDVFMWRDDESQRVILNLGTQRTWRSKATLDAVQASVERTVEIVEQLEIQTVCMPLIGAGLGGLDADSVKKAIAEVAEESPVAFVVCENYVAGKPPLKADSV